MGCRRAKLQAGRCRRSPAQASQVALNAATWHDMTALHATTPLGVVLLCAPGRAPGAHTHLQLGRSHPLLVPRLCHRRLFTLAQRQLLLQVLDLRRAHTSTDDYRCGAGPESQDNQEDGVGVKQSTARRAGSRVGMCGPAWPEGSAASMCMHAWQAADDDNITARASRRRTCPTRFPPLAPAHLQLRQRVVLALRLQLGLAPRQPLLARRRDAAQAGRQALRVRGARLGVGPAACVRLLLLTQLVALHLVGWVCWLELGQLVERLVGAQPRRRAEEGGCRDGASTGKSNPRPFGPQPSAHTPTCSSTRA